MDLQGVSNRWFTLDEMLRYIPDTTTEDPTDIDEEIYKEELNDELKTTDRIWLEIQAGQCAQFGHIGKKILYKIVKSSVGHPENSIAAANAITILKVMGVSLSCIDFTGAHIPSADLSSALLKGACFKNADLRGVNFSNAILNGVSFENANIENIELGILAPHIHASTIKKWIVFNSEGYFLSLDDRYVYIWNLRRNAIEYRIEHHIDIHVLERISIAFSPNKYLILKNPQEHAFFYLNLEEKASSSSNAQRDFDKIVISPTSNENVFNYHEIFSPDGRYSLRLEEVYQESSIVIRMSLLELDLVSKNPDTIFKSVLQQHILKNYVLIFGRINFKFSTNNEHVVFFTPTTRGTEMYILDMPLKIVRKIDGLPSSFRILNVDYTKDSRKNLLIYAVGKKVYQAELKEEYVDQAERVQLTSECLFEEKGEIFCLQNVEIAQRKYLVYVADKAMFIRDLTMLKNRHIILLFNKSLTTPSFFTYIINNQLFIGELERDRVWFSKPPSINQEYEVFETVDTREKLKTHLVTPLKNRTLQSARRFGQTEVFLPFDTGSRVITPQMYHSSIQLFHPVIGSPFIHEISEKINFTQTFVNVEICSPITDNIRQEYKFIREEDICKKLDISKNVYYSFKLYERDREVLNIDELFHCFSWFEDAEGCPCCIIFTLDNHFKIYKKLEDGFFIELFEYERQNFVFFDNNQVHTVDLCANYCYSIAVSDDFSLGSGYIALCVDKLSVFLLSFTELNYRVQVDSSLLKLGFESYQSKIFFKGQKLFGLDRRGYSILDFTNGVPPKSVQEFGQIDKIVPQTEEKRWYFPFKISQDESIILFVFTDYEQHPLYSNSKYMIVWDLHINRKIEVIKIPESGDILAEFITENQREYIVVATTFSGLTSKIRKYEVIDRNVVRLVQQDFISLEADFNTDETNFSEYNKQLLSMYQKKNALSYEKTTKV